MMFNPCVVNAAASKNQIPSKESNNMEFATMQMDSSSANFTASLEAYRAKQVMSSQLVPEAGCEFFATKESRRNDYKNKCASEHRSSKRVANHNKKINKATFSPLQLQLRSVYKDIKPESAIDFQSEFLSEAFGPKNVIFFMAFVNALRTSTSWTNTLSVITMYLSQVLSKDLVDTILSEVDDFRMKPEASMTEAWDTFKSLGGVFSKMKNTELYQRVRDLITICVVSGIISKTSEISVGALKAFNVQMNKKQFEFSDIWELAFKVIVYFAESGYRLFSKKEVSFLFEPKDVMAEYQKVIEYWPLCKNGNLLRVHGMQSRDFGCMIDKTRKMLDSCVRDSKGPERSLYIRMCERITNIKVEYLQAKTDGKLRQAPFVVCIIGDSSVGKSTISNFVAVSLLKAMKRPCTPDRIRAYNSTDKYDSWADGMTECLTIDDHAAVKTMYAEVDPVSVLLRLINNAPMTATKADVDEKGKIPIDLSLIILTMNNMSALTEAAACPTAIKRRFDYCIRPHVKPLFRENEAVNKLCSDRVIEEFGSMDGVPNAWDFQVIEPKLKTKTSVAGTKYSYQQELMSFNPKMMETNETYVEWEQVAVGDTYHMLHYLIKAAIKHDKVQKFVLDTNNKLSEQIDVCETCHNVNAACKCVKPELGLSLDWTAIANRYAYSPLNAVASLPRKFIFSRFGFITDFIFKDSLVSFYKREMYYYVFYWAWVFSMMISLLKMNSNPFMITLVSAIFYFALSLFYTILMNARARCYDEILASGYDFRRFTNLIYDYRVKLAGAVCIAAYGIYRAWKMYKFMGMDSQSALDPQTPKEKDERLVTDNPWADLLVEELPVQPNVMTMTHPQLVEKTKKNLCHVSWIIDNVRHHCNGFFACSNFVVLPAHMMPSDNDVVVTFVRGSENVVNSSFKSYCGFKDAVRIPHTDFIVVQVHSAPSFADLTVCLPTDVDPIPHVVDEIHRTSDGEIITDTYRTRPSNVSNNAEGFGLPIFRGSFHTLGKKSFDGRCMSALIAKARVPYIHGFHLGGNGKFSGCSGTLTLPQIRNAINSMQNVLPEASSGTFPAAVCGVTLLTSTEVHKKCATRFLPKGESNTVEVYGSTIGASTPVSDVIPTVISDKVAEITGYENKWGPPPFNSRRDHQVALATAANNCIGFKPSAVEWAIQDYIQPLIARFKELEMDIRPLSHLETINGIVGRRFIDKIVRNTSIGFPRSGKKNKFMKKLEPTEEFPDPVELDDETMAEVERMLNAYRAGVRAYSPAKTSLKDEPTKLTKKKCRVFYVTNTALQYLVRKYFLAICAAYSTVPLLSNCAVGINRQGPEWEELAEFIREHGDERILAGDYSKFDLHMPCQMVRSAFACHIEVAKAFGYSDDDLLIMRGLAADLSNPVIAWNGTLLQLGSLHMSGNNLTVYNGSVANNLYLRCHYFEQTGGSVPFRENVNIVAYGDDVIGSVSPTLDNFNHITFRDFLADHGMTFTMPDKESEATEFMQFNETDFLKCVNRYDPDLEHNVAQLSEDSIFKSLHRVLASKVLSREEAAAQNIDGAMREWFFHGREKFNLRLEQMKQVVAACDLKDYVSDYDTPFDARVEAWKYKYYMKKPEDCDKA